MNIIYIIFSIKINAINIENEIKKNHHKAIQENKIRSTREIASGRKKLNKQSHKKIENPSTSSIQMVKKRADAVVHG